MDKNDFEEVMYSIKKKEIDQVVSFLDGYEFIKNLTYTTKAKLGYRLKNKSYSLGQEVFYEGSNDSNVYFIESGQFVITKALYIRKDSGKATIDFRRAYSGKPFSVLKSTFNEETVCLFTDNIDDQPLNKNKESEYFDLKISIRTSGGMFGLTERFLGCPYRIMSIKCISKQGCLKYVDSDSLLDSCKSLDSSIFGAILAKKFSLTYQGIQNFCKWKKAEINQSYYKVPLLSQLQSEKMRKVRTFSVTQSSYKKEKEESYFNNLSEESPIKTQRKRKATTDNDISNGDSGSQKSDRSNSYANARNSPNEQKIFQKFTMPDESKFQKTGKNLENRSISGFHKKNNLTIVTDRDLKRKFEPKSTSMPKTISEKRDSLIKEINVDFRTNKTTTEENESSCSTIQDNLEKGATSECSKRKNEDFPLDIVMEKSAKIEESNASVDSKNLYTKALKKM